jgi:hypothetical protein
MWSISRRTAPGLPNGSRSFRASAASRRTGIGKLRLHADRDVRPEAAAEVVAMQGRLKYLGVQEPSLEAIYTRYFEARPERGPEGGNARHAA